MTTVGFQISGDFVTRHARDRVREGRWDAALNFLMTSLHGMTNDIAIRILKGEAKLTGSSSDPEGVGLDDDNDADHAAALKWQFGGCYTDSSGVTWRPSGIVTSWGIEDVQNGQHRSRHYAQGGTCHSLVVPDGLRPDGYFNEEADFIFRRVDNFPFVLVPPAKSPQEALDQYAALGLKIEETGHSQWYPDPLPAKSEVVTDSATIEPKTGTFFRADPPSPEFDLAALAEKIIEKADGDFFDLVVEGKTHRVPRKPFINWVLNRTGWWHLAPKWKPVSPQGIKMRGDDPYHSDWMLGGGFQPADWKFASHDAPLNAAAYEAAERFQKEICQVEVPVLSGTGSVYGRVVHVKPGERFLDGEIAVIRNAGPDYVQAAQDAVNRGAVLITPVGGSVAHLVTVFREQNLKIVRDKDAITKYPSGRYLLVDLNNGRIEASEEGSPIRLSDGTILDEKT